jgi:hypothetical protein
MRKKCCSDEEVASTDVQTQLPWNKIGSIQSLKGFKEKKIVCFYQMDRQLFRI